MRTLFSVSMLLIAVTFSFTLAGCGPSKPAGDKKKAGEHDHDHGHDHAHDHAAHGPHGGHVVELGDEEYHAEWTHDDASGKVTVFVLDKELKKEVPIVAETVVIKTKVGETEKVFTLEPMNRTTDEKPTAFEFSITDKTLLPILTSAGKGAEASLEIDVNGKPFVAKIEAHEEHDHKH
ncbi:MAG TPA: hypothetical protein VL096_03515 [Pirellulaceae bacterium]|nr:hypothetical protein [Pirellulaceae bacterium]